jgi:transposase
MVSKLKIDVAGRSAPGKNSARVFKTKTQSASDERSFTKSPVARARTNDTSLARVSISSGHPDAIVARRRQTLLRFFNLKKTHSQVKASKMAGASVATLWRWRKAYQEKGVAGLRSKKFNSGRRSPFTGIRLSRQAMRELELLHVESSNSREAWRKFSRSPACPPMVARYVQRSGRAPASLASAGRVQHVQARVFVSAVSRRIFLKLPATSALIAKLQAPAKFKFVEVKK